jgi:hypothetical protein
MARPPLHRPDNARKGSRRLYPSDHMKLLAGLLHPAGPDVVRRLAAAIMLVPEAERELVVGAIEARIAEVYAEPTAAPVVTVVASGLVRGKPRPGP